MKYVIDLDGTLCTQEQDYSKAQPFMDRISKVNQLHDLGNKIVIFTARGSESGIDWKEVTYKQLLSWNVNFDDLIFGKPSADYYIDDRNLNCSVLDSE